MQQRMMVHEDWATILGQGTIGNLLTTIAEGNAELARYLEYLYQEKKWRNARNMSSLTHLADLIAYKRALPKSAIGFVIVSHSDINGISRLSNYGTSFFSLDQASDYDNLTQNMTATPMEKDALVPWTADTGYVIPEGTIFKSGKGISYFSIETVESRALKEPYSAIKANETKYADFIKAGGWNGIKYLKIPVIQGEKRNISFGIARGARFESFTIDALNVENASNFISEKYFKVTIIPQVNIGTGLVEAKEEIWEPIIDIRLAGPYDKVFEYKILNNQDKVLIKFGDGITGQLIPYNSKVNCSYLETLGTTGNIEERYQVVQMILPAGFSQVDPRFNVQTNFLECTNIVPIMGGKDIEDEDEIRVNAPPTYLQSYSIATKASYLEQIVKNSPINLLHCKIFQSNIYETESYGKSEDINDTSFISNILDYSVLQEVSMVKNALLITAIRSNGTKLDSPETELIEPLIKAFDDNTSPNDSFDYIEPNMIEIRPNIIVNTIETLTETEIRDNIMPQVLDKYSIFNTDFEKPYYKTDIVDIVQNFSFSKYSNIFLEAKAKVNYTPTILSRVGVNRNAIKTSSTLFAFRFNFDKIFAQNQLDAGFRNFSKKSPYLLRADILFRNEPTKNRSLFLFDNRIKLQDPISLMEAEKYIINENGNTLLVDDIASYFNFEQITFYNNYSENYINQQVRTAQYNFIDRITSDSYVYQMKQFTSEPYEIRPLLQDINGKNKVFNINEVPIDERISFNFDSNVVSNQCYRKNIQFIDRCKLIFYENYNMPEDQNYAYGYLIIPINYVLTQQEIQQYWNIFELYPGFEQMAEDFSKFFNDQFTINVYAIPVQDEFTTENPFDIIYSNRDNILIQKNYLSSLS